MKVKRVLWAVVALGVTGGLVAAASAIKSSPIAARRAPTAPVTRGSLKLDVRAAGEFRASRTVSLSAPTTGGGLRLITLVDTGTSVKAGDVVMEFDPAQQQFALDQALSEVAQSEQEVIRRRADIEARPVVILKRGREQVALASGVEAGERLALGNPNVKRPGGR